MDRVIRILAVLALVGLAACGSPELSVEAQARRIESQVWSPYCPGRLLSDCTTQQADELRDRIEARLGRGESSREVLVWLEDNYGTEVLARPSSPVVWIVPAAVLGAGALLAVGLIRRWSRPPPPSPPPSAPLQGEDLERWVRRVRDEVEREP